MSKTFPARAAIAAAAVSACLAAPAWAAVSTPAQAQYEQDRADCLAGRSTEDRRTCLREAGARLQAARAHDLSSPSPAQLAANARKRCDVFKGDDRQTCLARVADGTVSGSVAAGGELREYREMVPPVESMPPTAAGPGPSHTPPPPVPPGQ